MLKRLSFSWEPRETENIFLMCFHNIFSHALSFFFFLSLYPTVLPSTCHLMFLVQAALGSVTQVLVAFPDVAAGGGVIMIIWALPSFSPPASRALFFFFSSVLLVTRPNLLPLFASPLSSCHDCERRDYACAAHV